MANTFSDVKLLSDVYQPNIVPWFGKCSTDQHCNKETTRNHDTVCLHSLELTINT